MNLASLLSTHFVLSASLSADVGTQADIAIAFPLQQQHPLSGRASSRFQSPPKSAAALGSYERERLIFEIPALKKLSIKITVGPEPKLC